MTQPSQTIPPELLEHVAALTPAQYAEFISLIGHWLLRAELDPSRHPKRRPEIRGLGQRHIQEDTDGPQAA